MGQITTHQPVLLLLAAFSRHSAALDWGLQRATQEWGPALMVSPRFDFRETDYYQSSMGEQLQKTFFTFQQPVDPADLPRWKTQTNAWELEYAQAAGHPEPRPLNLDPGYLSLAKLVLASTKDHAHRIYLREGIFAEITLSYRRKGWQNLPWTYPDYQRTDFQQFFTQCREALRVRDATTDGTP